MAWWRRSRRVFVHPGYLFDFSSGAYAVLSLLRVTPVFDEGIRRIRDMYM